MEAPAILIVEDDATLQRGLRDNFEARGYHVLTAADGQAGLDAALSGRAAVILLDIMLLVVNGYEIVRRQEPDGHSFQFGAFRLDRASRKLFHDGQGIQAARAIRLTA